MGNSTKTQKVPVEESFKEASKFFWSCDNTDSLVKSYFWTPYDEGDILYLESKFQEYQKGKKTIDDLDDPQKYKIDFKKWLEIDNHDPMNKKLIKRALPSDLKHVFRRNRFLVENNEAPINVDILEKDLLYGYLLGVDGFSSLDFKIMPEKYVEIKIPQHLKLFDQTPKFEDFAQIKKALIEQIHELVKNSSPHNKWSINRNIYDDCLEKINPTNFIR